MTQQMPPMAMEIGVAIIQLMAAMRGLWSSSPMSRDRRLMR